MATITIKYTAIVEPAENKVAQICSIFQPMNAAADLDVFAGTYYDTNVEGHGEGMSTADFIAKSIAHPGIVLALKNAMAAGEDGYEFDTADEQLIMYLGEVKPALVDQGFEITIA